jgi:hypothetical protein
MFDFQAVFPVAIHILYVISEHRTVIDTRLFRILTFFGVADPMRMFNSVILQHIMGIGYQYHYRQFYPEIRSYFSSYCSLYGADKIMQHIGKINNSMASWKLALIQASLIKIRCPQLLLTDGKSLADFDVTTVQSSSSKKEGAEAGYNKKRKGKPCFQLSATFIGKFFTDGKLFPGCSNPKDFFQKAVRRAISLGFSIEIVRADSAYMTLGNLLFLTKLSLGYAIGAPATFDVVKNGIALFKDLARKSSPRIIRIKKGIAICDLGEVTLENGVRTRIIIVRRISRKKKRGKWQINTYYYGIASDLKLSAKKLYRFYHKRQRIEAGFRELKNHWHLERLPFQNLKANEFRIISKMMAMTLFKIFQAEMLPKSLHSLLRKTFLRRILRKGLHFDESGKVQVRSETGYKWLLQRLLSKTARMEIAMNAC